jgi:hypothetical protein
VVNEIFIIADNIIREGNEMQEISFYDIIESDQNEMFHFTYLE